MKSYELPHYEGLGPEAAKRALAKFKADIMQDPDHPWNNPNHPQNPDAVRVFSQLNSMAQAADEDAAHEAEIAELKEVLGDDMNLSPDEALTKARTLLKTPEFMFHADGAERMEAGAKEKLRRKIHALTVFASRVSDMVQREDAERRLAARDAERASAPGADDGGDDDGDDGEAW